MLNYGDNPTLRQKQPIKSPAGDSSTMQGTTKDCTAIISSRKYDCKRKGLNMQIMTRAEAKEYVKRQEPTFLQRAKERGYICPFCGNGNGSDGDGIVRDTKDRERTHYKCFVCGVHPDIIDLIGEYYGLSDDKAKFEKAYDYYGVVIEDEKKPQKGTKKPETKTNTQETTKAVEKANTSSQEYVKNEEPEVDCTDFFLEAKKNNNYEYLKRRGINESVQDYFEIGYIEDWISPKAVETTIKKGGDPSNLPKTPRCIIPTSKTSYLARDTRAELTEDEKKYSKSKYGRQHLFNINNLYRMSVVFVTEGEIDAMSICECGSCGIGLGSCSNWKQFVDRVRIRKENYKDKPVYYYLMLDNDDKGKETQDLLLDALQKMGESVKIASYPLKYNDPNEMLVKDPKGFKRLIDRLKGRVNGDGGGNAGAMLDYFRTIEQQPEGYETTTGFKILDDKLSGGLHAGLIVLGAVSSLGKTTFTLQLADQIAAAGNDVLFFSMEMSKYELMAKSISRYTYNIAGREKNANNNQYVARDTLQVLNNKRYKNYSSREKEVIADAIDRYSQAAGNIYIYEGRIGDHRLTTDDIGRAVDAHYRKTGKQPVVIVDYLQIIAPIDVHMTDKQATDANVFELKEISRNFDIPVIAISSFNRENYKEPVSMSSFKESGAVEYSSDILFGLQYKGMDYDPKEDNQERSKRIRSLMQTNYQRKKDKQPIEIELKCLKNRNGYQFTIPFYMVPAFNYFEEIQEKDGFVHYPGSTPFDKLKKDVPMV